MLISRLYYYLVHFIAFLDTLRNMLKFRKTEPINRTSYLAFFGFPSTHGGLIWYHKKAHGALFRILVVEIPNDVSVSQ